MLDAAGLLRDSDAGLDCHCEICFARTESMVRFSGLRSPADAGTSLGALEAVAGEMWRPETGGACGQPRRGRDLPLAIS